MADRFTILCQDLINKLLSVDPEARPDGEVVRAHAFFAGLDWDNVCDEPKIFYPNPTAETDVSYFRGTGLLPVSGVGGGERMDGRMGDIGDT